MGIDCWLDMVTEKAKVRSEQKTYDKNNMLTRKAKDIRAKFAVKAHMNGEFKLRMRTRIRILFAKLSYIMTYSSYKLRGTNFDEF